MLRAMPHDGNGMRVSTMVTKLTSLISGSCYGALLKVWRLSKRNENRLLNHIDMDSRFSTFTRRVNRNHIHTSHSQFKHHGGYDTGAVSKGDMSTVSLKLMAGA